MKIGFTGTRDGMTPWQKIKVREYLLNCTELHNGWCYGADEDCLQIYDDICYFNDNDMQRVIVAHPPEKRAGMTKYKPKFVKVVWREPKPYLIRDEDIVIECEKLIATPRSDKEEMRSGTWATIRRARKHQRDYDIICPDGGIIPLLYDRNGPAYGKS